MEFDATEPFSVPFSVEARDGKLWIRPEWWPNTTGVELLLKGASWFGAQGSSACVMQLDIHWAEDYIAFLRQRGFNAVRLPLSATSALDDRVLGADRCREYGGLKYLDALDDLIQRLAGAGIFVMLDMHTVSEPEKNNGLWCAEPGQEGCSRGTTEDDLSNPNTDWQVLAAWTKLAHRFCARRNVILADVFNEVPGGIEHPPCASVSPHD